VSKSLGNAIDPVTLAERYGIDALRYYLLREIKATEDGDFTLERFIRAYNADLADQLGNLLSRFAGMVDRYTGGVVPAPAKTEVIDRQLIDTAQALPSRIDTALANFTPHEALIAIWDLIGAANKYVVDVQPWELAKQRRENPAIERRLLTTLYNLAETLRLVAYFLDPFLPDTARRIRHQLGLSANINTGWPDAAHWGGYPAKTKINPGKTLFPKLESSHHTVSNLSF
jgi:methionyl-tRNA synthetase